MNHFIYYVLPGENEELRYSLRSLAVNGPGDVKVSFIGDPPEWVDRDRVMVLPGNPYENRFQNSLHNITLASQYERGDFWIMNDDFYVMRSWPDPFPVWYWKPVEKHIRESMRDPKSAARKKVFRDTLNYLRHSGIENPNHYELHIPMKINGDEMMRILQEASHYINLESPPIWRTLYGNLASLPSEEHVQREDVKYHSPYTIKEELDFLSTDENSFHRTRSLVESKFTTPSPWEK